MQPGRPGSLPQPLLPRGAAAAAARASLAVEVGLPAPGRPGRRGGRRRCPRAARPGDSTDAGPCRLAGSAAAAAGAALSMGAVATGSSTRTWTPKVGKPGRLLQISERVASIGHLLGVDLDKAAKRAKPMQWLDVVQQLTRIESRVEELQVVVDQAAAAEEGARSPAALTAVLAAEHQVAAAAGAAQAPLVAPRHAPPRCFAAWRLPWDQAKPTLADWAEAKSASAQEATLRWLALPGFCTVGGEPQADGAIAAVLLRRPRTMVRTVFLSLTAFSLVILLSARGEEVRRLCTSDAASVGYSILLEILQTPSRFAPVLIIGAIDRLTRGLEGDEACVHICTTLVNAHCGTGLRSAELTGGRPADFQTL
ncbi:unnamed protein product [Prorocentrum cordatum]|uniref:Uncharacterized protein n=1 Tax=Prorocentrum cordatum TaxID=2364126 RepID=A0ABN9UC89_9DINO|nr:unnamed protein product [Polarella glacialis]